MTDLRGAEHLARAIKALDAKWKPHPKQIEPGRALFREGIRRIFLQFGRRTGKSALMSFSAVMWALTNPDRPVAIVAPLLKQCRALYLHSNVIKNLIPSEYLTSIHTTDGRFSMENSASIVLLGADDVDNIRGQAFSAVFLDEVKDLRPEFLDVLRPTLLDYKAPLIMAGTPPETPFDISNFYWQQVEIHKTSEDARLYRATTYDNPYIDKADIDKERVAYELRNESDIFKREYLAEPSPGGRRAVFGMFSEEEHVRPYPVLWSHVHKKISNWQLVAALDPGTASVFAALLGAVNPYTGQVRLLDEVYATQQSETSVGRMWPEIEKRMRQIYWPENEYDENQWYVVCDEAASWARNELLDQFEVASTPTQKSLNKKADGISLVKDLLRTKKLLISDRCTDMQREMRGYLLDKNGLYQKGNDHLIDSLRYLLHAANYTFQDSDPPPDEVKEPSDRVKVHRMEDDWAETYGYEHEQYLMDMPD